MPSFEAAVPAIDSLKKQFETEGKTARELYWAVVELLDRNFPAVFMSLTGRKLYDLIRKGSQPVSGEVLRDYRAKKAKRLENAWAEPIPYAARIELTQALEALWAALYPTALREAQEVADWRLAELHDRCTELHSQAESRHQELEALNAKLSECQQALDTANAQEIAADALVAQHAERLEVAQREKTQLVQYFAQNIDQMSKQLSHFEQERTKFLEQLHQTASAFEAAREAYQGLSQRSLLDIDMARQESKKLKKMWEEEHERLVAEQKAASALSQKCALLEQELTLLKIPAKPPLSRAGRGLRRLKKLRHPVS